MRNQQHPLPEPAAPTPSGPLTEPAACIVIARHQEYVTLNSYEFVCDDNDQVMEFSTPQQAKEYLAIHVGGIEAAAQALADGGGIYLLDSITLEELNG